jgi:isopenicillin-N epimerase
VHPRLRDVVRPLVPSHGAGLGFTEEFDWSGTFDPTAWLAAPSALELLGGLGWDRVRAYGRALVTWGALLVAEAVGVAPPVAPTVQMGLVDPGPLTAGQGVELNRLLYAEHRIEVPVTTWRDRRLLRLSGAVYNEPADYERLAAVLPGALAAVRSSST